LNDHYFSNLAHARALIGAWRDHNEARPHSPLGHRPLNLPRGIACSQATARTGDRLGFQR
jgi:transposase InsO family protein